MSWQDLNYSSLRKSGQRWWRNPAFQIVAIVATVLYAILLLAAASDQSNSDEAMTSFALSATMYILALTVSAAIASVSSDSKRLQEYMRHFAEDNHFIFENLSKTGFTASITSQDITTNSYLLESLHSLFQPTGSNKKMWELRGVYNGVPFSLYTALLGTYSVGRFIHWQHAGVIQLQLSTAMSPFIALSRRDYLTSYAKDIMQESGLQQLAGEEDCNERYICYQPYSQDKLSTTLRNLLEAVATIDNRTVELSGQDLYILNEGGLLINETEIKKAFQLIDAAMIRS